MGMRKLLLAACAVCALAAPTGAVEFYRYEFNLALSARELGVDSLVSPDNAWAVFLPDERHRKIVAVNLENGERLAVAGESRMNAASLNWYVYWQDARRLYASADAVDVYAFELNGGTLTLRPAELPQGDNVLLAGAYGLRGDIFSIADNSDKDLQKKYPDLRFEKGKESLTVLYKKKRLYTHEAKATNIPLSDDQFRIVHSPAFYSLSVAPNRRFFAYCVAWSSNGPWQLFLLDAKERTVQLIDDNFSGDTPELMLWTNDSRRFIYRQQTGDSAFRKLVGFKIME